MAILLVIFILLHLTLGARILGVFPTASISHQVVFQPICKELSLRGHQVVVLTPNPVNNSNLTNLTEIDMSFTYDIWKEDYIGKTMSKDLFSIDATMWLLNKIEKLTEKHFQRLQIIHKEGLDFDLILVETLHPLVYSLGCKFKVPIIGVSSLGLLLQTHDAVGNPTHPIIGLDIFANVMGEMGLYEKINSVVYNVWYRLVYNWYVLPRNDKIARTYWGNNCTYLGQLEQNVSLILMNTNPLLHLIRPSVPSAIQMGQMHISTRKTLPKDLQSYLDTSVNGVIYMSFGTNVISSKLSSATRDIIIKTLSELPYNVLWKWEEDALPDIPKNVVVRKWFSQQDILRHPNIKVFVTQGGLQSMEEAIANGVPMVGVPFIADQPLNVMKMVNLGFGRSINHVTMTKDEFKKSIIDVAENSKYRDKLKSMKTVLTDQPMTGVEKSIWWIEYVLRHKGVKHLRSPQDDTFGSKYFLLEVTVFFIILVLVVILVGVGLLCEKKVLRFVYRRYL